MMATMDFTTKPLTLMEGLLYVETAGTKHFLD